MDIKGFNGLYQISDDSTKVFRKGYWVTQKNKHGEYKRFMKPKECKMTIDSEGYYAVSIEGKRQRLHRIIYETFIGEIPDGCVIDHKNGNKLDNSLDNLRAVPQRVNARNTVIARKPDIRKMGNKYFLRFSSDGDRKYYGMFDTYNEAEEKYNELYEKRQNHYNQVGLFFER